MLQRAANQALWEGVLAIVAAVLVATLTVHMWRVAKRLKGEIESRLHESSLRPGVWAMVGVFGFTLLMITREGMETALLMNALLFQVQSYQLLAGAVAGILCAASVAWLWSRYGHRVNLARFFQATAIFLLIFVAQLFIYGFHGAHRSQRLSIQRAAPLGHRALRAGRPIRPVLDLSAGGCCRSAGWDTRPGGSTASRSS